MAARKKKAAPGTPARQTSPSGYWLVHLTRTFTRPGFAYRPGREHRVSDRLMAAMKAEEGLVANARPAD